MLLPSITFNLPDPTDVLPVSAYCTPAEITVRFETGDIRCVFYCWKSEQAFLSGCKPFAALPVTIPADQGGSAIIKDKSSVDICQIICDHILTTGLKAKIEEDAKQNSANS